MESCKGVPVWRRVDTYGGFVLFVMDVDVLLHGIVASWTGGTR